MKTLLVAMLTMVCVVSPAFAASPRSKYVRAVTKIAPPATEKPSGLCVCQNNLDLGQVGYLRQSPGSFNALNVTCVVPGFDGDGEVAGGTVCSVFVPLVR